MNGVHEKLVETVYRERRLDEWSLEVSATRAAVLLCRAAERGPEGVSLYDVFRERFEILPAKLNFAIYVRAESLPEGTLELRMFDPKECELFVWAKEFTEDHEFFECIISASNINFDVPGTYHCRLCRDVDLLSETSLVVVPAIRFANVPIPKWPIATSIARAVAHFGRDRLSASLDTRALLDPSTHPAVSPFQHLVHHMRGDPPQEVSLENGFEVSMGGYRDAGWALAELSLNVPLIART